MTQVAPLAVDGVKLCIDCLDPLPADAHGQTRYCAGCAAALIAAQTRESNRKKQNRKLLEAGKPLKGERQCLDCGAAIPAEAHGRVVRCPPCNVAATRQRQREASKRYMKQRRAGLTPGLKGGTVGKGL